MEMKTRLFGRDLKIKLKKLKPKEGDILLVSADSMNAEETNKLKIMVGDAIKKLKVALIVTNYEITTHSVTPRADGITIFSAPGLSIKELKEMKSVVDEFDIKDLNAVFVNNEIEAKR